MDIEKLKQGVTEILSDWYPEALTDKHGLVASIIVLCVAELNVEGEDVLQKRNDAGPPVL